MTKSKLRRITYLLCLGGLAMRYFFTAPGFYGFRTETYSSSWLWRDHLGNLQQFYTYLSPWITPTLLATIPLVAATALLLWQGEQEHSTSRPWLETIDRYFSVLATASFFILLVLKILYFSGPLLSQDEKAYYFEADVLRMGCLRAPPPPFLDSFQQAQVFAGNFWTSTYQVGWPATIAAAKSLRLAPFLNCGWWLAILFSLRKLGSRFSSPEAGLAAAGIFAVSPQFWMLAFGDYPHLQTTALALLSWVAFLHFQEEREFRRAGPWAVGCIILWTAIAATRMPETLTAMIVPLGLLVAEWAKARDLSKGIRGIGLLAAGSLASVGTCALLNWGQTGSPTTFAYQLYYGDLLKQYRFWGGLYNLAFYILRSAWWMPPLFFPLLLRRPRSSPWPLWGAIAAQACIYLHIFTNACTEWGARYYTIPLAVGCLMAGCELARKRITGTAAIVAGLVSLACGLHTFSLCLPHYQGIVASQRALEIELGPTPAVVFVRKNSHDGEIVARIANQPNFEGKVTAIWLEPHQNQKIRDIFKTRPAWLVDWDENGGYHLEPYPDKDVDLFSSTNYYSAGVNYLSLHNLPAALRCFKQSLPGPDEGRTLTLIGLLERDQGDISSALVSLQKAVQVAPLNWAARNYYAQVLQSAGQSGPARSQYEEVLRGAAPDSQEARAAAAALREDRVR